jgi:RNase H-fold protein (predicted Holliday junction resolvase)
MESITLITIAPPAGAPTVDRGGGATHGAVDKVAAKVGNAISYDSFAAQLEKILAQVQSLATRVKAGIGEYSADEIAIGLAVSAEGSIGIATAGIEASIEVTLKRRGSADA